MKIEKINSFDYRIYIYAISIKKDDIYRKTKDIIFRLQKRLNLKGFYRVITFYNDFGLFIRLLYIDDSFSSNSLDLKIEIKEEELYYKTKDYFLISDCRYIRYLDSFYYALVDDSFSFSLDKTEFGDFVFGVDLDDVFYRSIVI